MQPRFTYDSEVRVTRNAPQEMRPGKRAWVVAIKVGKNFPTYREFKSEVVYTVEFEDGSALDIEECFLEPLTN